MKFFVVRHPWTQAGAAGITKGWADSPLTPAGIEAAEKLGDFFQDKDIPVIYSSDLGRCLETSRLINKKLNVKIIKAPELREQNFGVFNNTRITKKEFDSSDHSAIPPKGESLVQLKERVLNYITTRLPKDKDKILAVTHYGCFQSLLSEALGVSLDSEKCQTTPLTAGQFELENNRIKLIERIEIE